MVANLYCDESCEFGKEMIQNYQLNHKSENIKAGEFYTPSESAFKSDCARKECVDKTIIAYEHVIDFAKFLLKFNQNDDMFLPPDEKKRYEEDIAVVTKNLEKYRSTCTGTQVNGNSTQVNGNSIQANGNNTQANGNNTQANGNNTQANGNRSSSASISKMNSSNVLLFTLLTFALIFLF